jgi:hypothetical protein
LRNTHNYFPRVISVNMLAIPQEQDCVVVGLDEISDVSA